MKLSSRIYVVVVGATTVIYFLVPPNLQDRLYEAIAVSAAVAMFWGTIRNKPERSEAWFLMAAGVAMFAAGDIAFADGQAVPSSADMLYMSGYPLLGLGLSGLSPWRPSHRYSNVVVAGAVSTVVAVVSGFFLIVPANSAGSVFLSQLVTIGYTVIDAALLLLLIRAVRSDAAGGVSKMLGVGLTLLLVADVVYAASDFGHDYASGQVIDGAWLLSYAFFGAALLGVRAPWADAVFERFAPAVPRGHHVSRTAIIERVTHVQLPRVRAHDLRFGVIIAWVGRMLFALGLTAVVAGVMWFAPGVILLGGAYFFTGLSTWIVGSRAVRL